MQLEINTKRLAAAFTINTSGIMEPMNILANNGTTQIQKNRFDFDIGYFIKSPCRSCPKSKDMPLCHKDCEIIDKIQMLLVGGISSQSSRNL